MDEAYASKGEKNYHITTNAISLTSIHHYNINHLLNTRPKKSLHWCSKVKSHSLRAQSADTSR